MGAKAILVGIVAIVCGVYYSEIGSLFNAFDREIKSRFQPKPRKIWKLEDLEKYRHISIFGHVFDVSGQPKFYGPDGHYNQFTGADATRAFALSDLSGKSLMSTLEGLSTREYESALEWLDSFQKKYPLVGYLDDLYFDFRGRPKPLLQEIRMAVETAAKTVKAEVERYPYCNTYSSDNENYVDCIEGFKGDWYPRLISLPSSPQPRCACLQLNFLNSGRIMQFPGCPEFSSKCSIDPAKVDAIAAKFYGGSS